MRLRLLAIVPLLAACAGAPPATGPKVAVFDGARMLTATLTHTAATPPAMDWAGPTVSDTLPAGPPLAATLAAAAAAGPADMYWAGRPVLQVISPAGPRPQDLARLTWRADAFLDAAGLDTPASPPAALRVLILPPGELARRLAAVPAPDPATEHPGARALSLGCFAGAQAGAQGGADPAVLTGAEVWVSDALRQPQRDNCLDLALLSALDGRAARAGGMIGVSPNRDFAILDTTSLIMNHDPALRAARTPEARRAALITAGKRALDIAVADPRLY
ncbi:hypothetical protein [Oceanicella sp. SM1341]|uniref:hypothetical protein n=1 Tax=Oceanicella sp. SM1341 TaxID=1548889 RepID=UPI000E511514|nr:hypothetical protein [Oceanicella sp. SM1341]